MRALIGFALVVALLAPSSLSAGLFPAAPRPSGPAAPTVSRLVLFIGVDISGSFMNGKYFDDSIEFLARYIHAHLNGLGGMEVPNAMFVGSIGGVNKEIGRAH